MKSKLKPSARIKRRYLLLEAKDKNEVEEAILDYVGILGLAKASPLFISDKKFNDKIILAINRKSLAKIRASFELSPNKIKVLRVSGTLKGLSKK